MSETANSEVTTGTPSPERLGSPVVKAWIKEQYELYRYWCEAGPGGRGWGRYAGSGKDRSQYVEIRDWLFSLMNEDKCVCATKWPTKHCPDCGRLANTQGQPRREKE